MYTKKKMATSKITIRSIDYHKYRSLIVERSGASDDRQRCDREVAALCDTVRLLHQRNDRFHETGNGRRRDLGDDRARLDEICGWYKLMLESRRIRSVDVRLRSGWWDVSLKRFLGEGVLHYWNRFRHCSFVSSFDTKAAHQISRNCLT